MDTGILKGLMILEFMLQMSFDHTIAVRLQSTVPRLRNDEIDMLLVLCTGNEQVWCGVGSTVFVFECPSTGLAWFLAKRCSEKSKSGDRLTRRVLRS